MRLVQVAVPVPQLDALTYAVPPEFPDPVPGARVLVPLGKRVVTGIVLSTGDSRLATGESQDSDRDSRLATGDSHLATGDSRLATSDSSLATRDRLSGEIAGHEPAAFELASPEQQDARRESIKSITDILDETAFLPADVVRLTNWVADYYACGPGEAIAAAMPPRAWIESERFVQITDAGHVRLLTERGNRRQILDALVEMNKPVRVETIVGAAGRHAALVGLERDGLVTLTRPLKGSASAYRTVRVAALTVQGLDAAAPSSDTPLKLSDRQREALDVLKGVPLGIDTADLSTGGITAATLKRLSDLGLLTFTRRRVDRDPFEQGAVSTMSAREPVVLTEEQTNAFERLSALAGLSSFRTVLLHGVTGSGKTELYLRLAHTVHKNGRGVLMLVPEIALTPAVAAIFRLTFGDRVAIQHSGLSDGERHDQWQRIRRGDVDVVVGTRSAVFAPVHAIGLIIVDEEHDGSYKQEESPRYHGRDVAVVRGQQAGALVVLGSATPSMESFHNAQSGRYDLLTLERRVLDRPMAAVRVVDMRLEYAASGPDVILSAPLCEGLTDRLQRREQSIVLLNRRGYATSVFCRQCASTLECPNCSVSLTVHKAARRARCHYCNYAIGLPRACTHCKGPYLEQIGFGTERVEAEIVDRFPGVRVARVDRDTVRKRGAIVALLSRFAGGEIDVLVGTQMIAKGHDFPRVTLVGVISADVGLGHADFRAAERTFQLLTQVAGRAGRGEIQGEAIVQTLYPKHYSIRHACRQDYNAFYNDEIVFRRGMKYPPAVALINAVVKARTREAAMQDAGEIVDALRFGGESYRVLGPAPAPLSRLRGEHRAQLFIKGANRPAMRQALQVVLSTRPEIRRRTIVDVDPMSVL
jgi:primosomal protein N' (replication factor Y) (superfamily II helicase)